MQTSARGRDFLERQEGVVLRAYRCPAGRWTIGAGLTAASGVVRPKAGMVLTAEAASALLAQALARNYEPAVTAAMSGATQAEFDAGVSFHFNTGAIGRATWVRLWRAKARRTAIEAAFMSWTKGGGRVLPGLVRRRSEECALLMDANYGAAGAKAAALPAAAPPAFARIAPPLTSFDVIRARAALDRLGYATGKDSTRIAANSVRDFQRDHALTVDGAIGPATLATLDRMLAARTKAAVAAPVVAVAAAAPALEATTTAPVLDPWMLALLCGGAVLAALWLAWHYRDALAAALQHKWPRLAAGLRRF